MPTAWTPILPPCGSECDAHAEPKNARRSDRLDVIRVRGVLRRANRLNGVVVEEVEQVELRNEAGRPDANRAIRVQVEVLIIRESRLADAVQEHGRDADAVRTRRRLDADLFGISLTRIVESRHVDVIGKVVQAT